MHLTIILQENKYYNVIMCLPNVDFDIDSVFDYSVGAPILDSELDRLKHWNGKFIVLYQVLFIQIHTIPAQISPLQSR
jgi:hypothetical protein